MSRKHIQEIYPDQVSNSAVCVIIPAAGCGRRMKSYGPKSLLEIKNQDIISNQLSIIEKILPQATVSIICGFKSEKLMRRVPESIIKVENELYETTNVARSIGIGLRTIRETATLLLIYGDLFFNSITIECLDLSHSCVLINNNTMTEEEVGCIIDENGSLQNMMYDLPNKWAQIAVFNGKELTLLKQLCWDKKNYHKFGFEIINEIIEKGGSFMCLNNRKCKVIDIDTSKDIERAREIFS
jgi:choline kinase